MDLSTRSSLDLTHSKLNFTELVDNAEAEAEANDFERNYLRINLFYICKF